MKPEREYNPKSEGSNWAPIHTTPNAITKLIARIEKKLKGTKK